MTWGLIRPFNKYIFNIPTSSHDCCSHSEAGSVGRLRLCLLNWSWRHAPRGSERIEPDSQSVLRIHSLVMPRQLVVT